MRHRSLPGGGRSSALTSHYLAPCGIWLCGQYVWLFERYIRVKNAPEDFVYYVPKCVEYTTTYTNYTINKNYQVTGEGETLYRSFLLQAYDRTRAAHCTMMGGDISKLTQVRPHT